MAKSFNYFDAYRKNVNSKELAKEVSNGQQQVSDDRQRAMQEVEGLSEDIGVKNRTAQDEARAKLAAERQTAQDSVNEALYGNRNTILAKPKPPSEEHKVVPRDEPKFQSGGDSDESEPVQVKKPVDKTETVSLRQDDSLVDDFEKHFNDSPDIFGEMSDGLEDELNPDDYDFVPDDGEEVSNDDDFVPSDDSLVGFPSDDSSLDNLDGEEDDDDDTPNGDETDSFGDTSDEPEEPSDDTLDEFDEGGTGVQSVGRDDMLDSEPEDDGFSEDIFDRYRKPKQDSEAESQRISESATQERGSGDKAKNSKPKKVQESYLRHFPTDLALLAKKYFPNASSMDEAVAAYIFAMEGRPKDVRVPDKVVELAKNPVGLDMKTEDNHTEVMRAIGLLNNQLKNIMKKSNAAELLISYLLFDYTGFRKKEQNTPATIDFLENGMNELINNAEKASEIKAMKDRNRAGTLMR